MSKRSAGLATPEQRAAELGLSRHEWADRFTSQWRADPQLTAAKFVEQHPEIADDAPLLATLAYEEYLQRRRRGENLDSEVFFARFSGCRDDVRALLTIHRFLAGQSGWLPDLEPSQIDDDRQRPAEIDWPKLGKNVGGFKLLEVLGQGAFARVYLAEEISLGQRRVVVKTSLGGSEAETLGKLEHANIVPVYSVQFDPETGLTLICMPFLGRQTLNDVLPRLFDGGPRPTRGRQLVAALVATTDEPAAEPPARAAIDPRLAQGSYVDAVVHLGAQLADALDYTNSQGVCHRDLKPSNVLIDTTGKPMLLDFNLSYDDRREIRGVGGTPRYLAPEVIRTLTEKRSGGRFEFNLSSDLYSLSVILYELLTGEWPFGEVPSELPLRPDSAEPWLSRQRDGARSLCERNPEVEPALADLIERCLAFEVDRRPGTAFEMAKELRRLSTRRSRAKRWLWRHRRALRRAIVPACIALALGSFALSTLPPYAQRQFTAGQGAYDRGEYQRTLAHLATAEERGFDGQQLLALRGKTFHRLALRALGEGDYPAARDYGTQAIESGMRTWPVYVLRGRAHFKLKETEKALKDYDQAADRTSTPLVDAARGDCFCADEQWAWAILAYNKAMSGGCSSAGLYNNLAYALISSGHREEALGWLNRALATDSQLVDAYYQRASIATALAAERAEHAPDSAMSDIEVAIQIAPRNYRLYLVAANMHAWNAQLRNDARRRTKATDCLLRSIRLGFRIEDLPPNGPLAEIAKGVLLLPEFDAARKEGELAARAALPGLVDSLAGVEFD